MHLIPAIVAVVLAGAVAGAAVRPLLADAARRSLPAYRLLAGGVGLGLATLALGGMGLAVLAGRWGLQQPQRMDLASVVAVGMALAGLLSCGAVLRLPGVATTPNAALRLLLDGLIIGAALWFVGWVLCSEPTRLLGSATPRACPAVVLATVTAAAAAGLAFIVVVRTARPRDRLTWLCAGLAAAPYGGLLLAAGLCQGGVGMAATGAGLLAGALLLSGFAARRADPPPAAEPDVVQRDSGHAFLPMLAMAVSAMYHLLRGGNFDVLAVVAGSLEGFALVARQYLTLRDVRGYARRLAEREAHFRELAHSDPLTGLANRRGLARALRIPAAGPGPYVLLTLDLDGFKAVNDVRGHDAGDAVLMEVGHRLRGNLRPADLPARLGGDEFAVLMRAGPVEAQRVAERLLGVLSRPYEQPEGPVFLSVSIGLAAGTGADGLDVLLRNADLALRYAKQRGKNRVERYDVAYEKLLRRRATLEHELRGAIERDELRLAFQPVAALPSMRPAGAEALLRWRHPELGSVRPDEFIPLAEECGMIAKLGAWVLHQACHQLSRWLADGHDVWLSVNVSPRELHAPAYVDQVAEALRAHNVPPQRLVLEVTEHAVATDLDELIRRLTALRLTGVRIALDDFGAGYSSLGQLRRLPIDILKIDHSLVAEHEPVRPVDRDGPAFAPMVDIVMRLGHQLGLQVIAEGVTTRTELAAVVAAGCRFGQGQLFGWGVPAEHFEAMLEAASSSTTRPLPLPPAPRRRDQLEVGPDPARGGEDATSSAQNVGSVDSGREMRQA